MASPSPSISPRGSFASTSAAPARQDISARATDAATRGGSSLGLDSAVGTARRSLFSGRRVSAREGGKSAADEALLADLDESDSACVWLDHAITKLASSRNPAEKDWALCDSTAPASLAQVDEDLARLIALLSQAGSEASADIDEVITQTSQTLPHLGTQLRLVKDAGADLRQQIGDVRAAAGLDQQDPQPGQASVNPDDEGLLVQPPARKAKDPSNGLLSRSNRSASKQGQQGSGDASASSHSDASAVLARLAALSTLRSRMTAARDVLRLAESWSTLSSDIAAYLSDAKYSLASNRLAEASASLAVFERTPEYEGRSKLLRSLVDALETQVRPLVLHAAATLDLEAAVAYANVLRSVGRSQEFGDLWRGARRAGVVESWNSAHGEPSKRMENDWPKVIGLVDVLLEAESALAPRIFPADPQGALNDLIISCIEALEPSLAATLRDALERTQEAAVMVLLQAHTAACSASVRWTTRLSEHSNTTSASRNAAASPTATIAGGSSSPGPSSSPRTESRNAGRSQRSASISKIRRSSRRASLLTPLDTTRGSPDDAEVVIASAGTQPASAAHPDNVQTTSLSSLLPQPGRWEMALWSAFTPHQSAYTNLEACHVEAARAREEHAEQRSELTSTSPDELLQHVRAVASLAEEALSRALSLTHGLAAPGFLSCIDRLVEKAIDGTREKQQRDTQTVIESTRIKAGEALASGEENYGEGEEWRAFEIGIAQLRAAKAVAARIDSLEDKLALAFGDIANAIVGLGTRTGEDALKRVLASGPDGAQSGFALLAGQLDLASSVARAAFENIRTHRMHIGSSRNGSSALRSAGSIDHRISLTQLPASKLGSVAGALLPSTRSSLRAHVRALQRAQCDIILAPLLPLLEGYAALPAWEANRLPGASNEYDLAMPTFSLSPSRTIGRIGESLLDLPRLLEVWADDAALGWAMHALPYVVAEEEEAHNEEAAETASVSETASRLVGNTSKRLSFAPDTSADSERRASRSPQMERRSLHRPTASVASIATTSPSVGASAATPTPAIGTGPTLHPATHASHAEPTPETVLQAYLRALALSLLSHVTDVVLPSIARLTSAGASQLAADLDYLDNILASLNVDAQSGGLRDWRDAAALTDQEGKKLLKRAAWQDSAALGGPDQEKRRLVTTDPFAAVARMRAW